MYARLNAVPIASVISPFLFSVFVHKSKKRAGFRKQYFTQNRFSAFYFSYTYGINL